MHSEMMNTLDRVATLLELNEPTILPPGQTTNGWVLRWKNTDGKSVQVWIHPEHIISRQGAITVDGVKDEVLQQIAAGNIETLD